MLLVLLSLDIKNIRMGPRLPAYMTPPVRHVLENRFNLKVITDLSSDLRALAA